MGKNEVQEIRDRLIVVEQLNGFQAKEIESIRTKDIKEIKDANEKLRNYVIGFLISVLLLFIGLYFKS